MIEDPYNRDIKLFLWMQDITDKKTKQLEIREPSEKDGMTGVYNRKTAEDLICNNLKKRVPGIFLLVDMVKLKKIKDELGHKEGDKAIKGMATILKGHFHHKDIIGRIGGDEFVVLAAPYNKKILPMNPYTIKLTWPCTK